SSGNQAPDAKDNAASKSDDRSASGSSNASGSTSTDRQASSDKDNATSDSGLSSPSSVIQRLKEMDEQRPSFPGEHWIVFAAGAFLMAKAARQRSFIAQALMLAAGSALIGRAASGRDGLIKVA